MFCPRCGAQVSDGAKFCTSCGHAFPAGERGPSVATPQPAAAPARHRGRLVAIVVAVVVVAALAGTGVWFAFFSPYPIDEATFPDPALRAAVTSTYDADHDGQLSRDEGRAVTEMTLSSATALSSLGRCFPNLTSLTVTGGTLTDLDVSDLGQLTTLDVADEPLATLDVSHNSGLTTLRVPDSTQVTGLDATPLHESWVVEGVAEEAGDGYRTDYAVSRNATGQVTERSASASYANSHDTFVYDDSGKLESVRESFVRGGSGSSEVLSTYTYDEAGRVTAISCSNEVSYEYSYDDAGRLAVITTDYGQGTPGRLSYVYDERGRLKECFSEADGWVSARDTYAYDDADRCVQKTSTSYNADGTTMREETIEYTVDSAGNVTRAATVASSGYGIYNTPVDFTYDDEGRMIAASAAQPYALYEVSISYDDHGNVSQVQQVGTNGSAGDEGGWVTTYTPSYTRFFVAEGAREPDPGLEVSVPISPMADTQLMVLVGVWGVPSSLPATPEPYALLGDQQILF